VFKLTLLFRGKLLKIHHLIEGDSYIGRDPDCALQIDSLAVEPRHVRLNLQDQQLTLYNLCDTGNVLVNHKSVSEQPLQDGDQIQIGKHTIKLTVDESAAALVPPPTPEAAPAATPAAPARIGWLQVLSGPHLGRAFPIEPDQHRIGKPGLPSALISHADDRYQIVTLECGDCRLDGQALDASGRTLNDGAIIECGELRLQFFMDQAVSVPVAHRAPPSAATLRHHSRISFDAQAYLRSETMVWQTQLIDIALKGALIARPADWQGAKGDSYLLELLLDDEQAAIRMMVTVMHVQTDRIGLHCEHIDIDSVTHLRRLIELNLGDPDLLERELAGLE
jgi:hypothetical protein